MKFEYDQVASMIVNFSLGMLEEGQKMQVYCAVEGRWQFMINYDEMHDQWTATYRKANQYVEKGEKVSAMPCEPPLVITGKKYRYYKSREEAEAAAHRKLQSLQN